MVLKYNFGTSTESMVLIPKLTDTEGNGTEKDHRGTGTDPPLVYIALRQQQPGEQPPQLVLDPQTAGLLPGLHIDRQEWRTPLELHCGGPHCTLG